MAPPGNANTDFERHERTARGEAVAEIEARHAGEAAGPREVRDRLVAVQVGPSSYSHSVPLAPGAPSHSSLSET